MRYAEIHIIHNLPPQAANRDEAGRPKTAYYAGVERARWSSQAQKRAMRLLAREASLVPKEEAAWRTRHLHRLLAERLPTLDEEVLARAVRGLLKAMGIAQDGAMSRYLLFVSQPEVEAMADLVASHLEDLLVLAEADEEAQAAEGERKPRGKRKKGESVPENLLKEAKRLLPRINLELALFGRMLADLPESGVDGALAVAHAIGVGQDLVEEDYFVGMDDWAPAAGMIEHTEFAATTLYRYAVLDLDELARKVGEERALLGLRYFLHTFPLALPAGRIRSFAHYGEPEVVLVSLGEGAPRNLARAFDPPVRPHPEAPTPLLALRRLLGLKSRYEEVYGGGSTWFGISLYPEALAEPGVQWLPRFSDLQQAALREGENLLRRS